MLTSFAGLVNARAARQDDNVFSSVQHPGGKGAVRRSLHHCRSLDLHRGEDERVVQRLGLFQNMLSEIPGFLQGCGIRRAPKADSRRDRTQQESNRLPRSGRVRSSSRFNNGLRAARSIAAYPSRKNCGQVACPQGHFAPLGS